MLDQGNSQLSAVGFYNPTLGQRPLDEFFGGASAADGALPYEVRWDDSLDGGNGGWKIFLPTPHLLSYNGGDIATSDISGVTAVADGWYSLDDVQRSSTHVWLVLSVDDTDGSVEAELSPTQGQSVTGTTVHNVCVAEISYADPPGAGEPPAIVVKQSLVGAPHLTSRPKHNPEPFDYHVTKDGETTSYEVDGGDFFFDGESQSVDGIEMTGSGDETVYLVCTGTKATPEDASGEESYEWEFKLDTEPGQAASDGKVINVKLYDFTAGVVTKDYRETNLPVYSGGVQYMEMATDNVSIDGNGGENNDKLQISHFNDDEKDSGKGLANRLRADPETGEITSNDKELMLLGRKNGEIIYVPLTGNGEDPSPDDPSSHDPCDHDPGGGSAGGVTPDSDESHGGGGIGAPSQGGVPAEGEPHKGDDDCNCE